ncbi:hypothetical protein MPSEU_000474300 [Mayamaea pseudoterrestris]|nr:hypothetical protein MPSEU_000474300 [Mayamaea pseudoterrestris]
MPPAKRQIQVENEATQDKRSKPPQYGQQEYWNVRYQAVLLDTTKNNSPPDNTEAVDAPLPYHEWYFTYDELRPILLPLLFGAQSHLLLGDGNEDDVEQKVSGTDAASESENMETERDGRQTTAGPDNLTKTSGVEEEYKEEGLEDEDSDAYYDDYDDDEDEEESATRPGLVGKSPITILEVGCGDRPLGAALANELKTHLHGEKSDLPVSAASFKSIICSDYSPIVIDVMRKEHITSFTNSSVQSRDESKTISVGGIPLQFEVLDAAALPYPSNSINLVLEKGTIDAVLSDETNGEKNAIQIMSECARVVMKGGYILLASHLNAHFPSGLSWLETIIFTGLKQGDSLCEWSIEVHGKEDVNGADNVSDDGVSIEATGPAVYIISKHASADGPQKETVPVQFFGY